MAASACAAGLATFASLLSEALDLSIVRYLVPSLVQRSRRRRLFRQRQQVGAAAGRALSAQPPSDCARSPCCHRLDGTHERRSQTRGCNNSSCRLACRCTGLSACLFAAGAAGVDSVDVPVAVVLVVAAV
eukprot:339991-Chlamydomonas_euryale.AAC.1